MTHIVYDNKLTVYSDAINVGPIVGGDSRNVSAILYFDVYKPMTLYSVQTRTSFAGYKPIKLLDNEGNTVYSSDVYIPNAGKDTTIDLNWHIEPGTGYQLLTLENSALFRLNSGVQYPYTVEGVCSITGCDRGSTYFYSWFNWSVQQTSDSYVTI